MAEPEAPSTKHSGESNPNTGQNVAWGALLLFVLAAPVAVLTAVATYLVFSVGRVHYRVLGGFFTLYGLALLVSGQIVNVFEMYVYSILDAIELAGDGDIGAVIASMFIQQAPASILVGGFIGYFISLWRYRRRPVWMEENFRRTPLQLLRRRKNINDIRSDKNTPVSGRTLGVTYEGDRINQSEQEAAAHTLMLGGSGTGKTTTLMVGARDVIKRGESLLIVDMKGSPDMAREAGELAERYGRPFYHWTSQNTHAPYTGPSRNGPAYYDPIGRGDATRRTDIVMAGREWSEDYYRVTVQSYLQKAFQIITGTPQPEGARVDSISEIISLLDPQALKNRTVKLVGNPDYNDVIEEIYALAETKASKDLLSSLSSMKEQLAILRNSIQGQWLRKDPKGEKDINFFDAAHKGAVVVFSLDSATYKSNAKTLGDLIIQDLQTVAGELRENPSRYPLNVFIDEFSAIGSDNVVGLLARCRDANIPVTLSTQSLGDLRTVSSSFMGQLTGIVSSLVIHRANTREDAEAFAGISGKEMKWRHSEKVEMRSGWLGGMGVGASTGGGTVEKIEDYKISPTEIQELQQGELYFIAKSTNRLIRVEVIKEDGLKISHINDHSTSADDVGWTPGRDERVSVLSEEEKSGINLPNVGNTFPNTQKPEQEIPTFSDTEEEWDKTHESVSEHKSNPDRIKAILSKENFAKSEGETIPTLPSSVRRPTQSHEEVPEDVAFLEEVPQRTQVSPTPPKMAPPIPSRPSVDKPRESHTSPPAAAKPPVSAPTPAKAAPRPSNAAPILPKTPSRPEPKAKSLPVRRSPNKDLPRSSAPASRNPPSSAPRPSAAPLNPSLQSGKQAAPRPSVSAPAPTRSAPTKPKPDQFKPKALPEGDSRNISPIDDWDD